MTPRPIALPAALLTRLGPNSPTQLLGVGNATLLGSCLFGLIASRECPGHVLLDSLEQVPQWVKAGRIIVSGFHSPLEQQVLRSLLRRNGQAVKVLAHGFSSANYRPRTEEREPLEAGRLLILTACTRSVLRTTRATALERNRLVQALATDCILPFIADNSPLRTLASDNSPGSK
jgi:predicted Rossmann fold nucleotide-binding protein DprA/Smf involved in DNA uptake